VQRRERVLHDILGRLDVVDQQAREPHHRQPVGAKEPLHA